MKHLKYIIVLLIILTFTGQAYSAQFIPKYFLQLRDVPSSFSGSGGYCTKVNVGATALEFTACETGSHATFLTAESDPIIKAINGFVQCNGTTCTAATTMNVTSIDMSGQTSSKPFIGGISQPATFNSNGMCWYDEDAYILYLRDQTNTRNLAFYPKVLTDAIYQALHANLTSLSALSFASTSFIKMTSAGTFGLDTNTYLTSETSHTDVVVDGDFTSEGLMKRGGSSGSYSIVTDNSANWNTAYGWGNHASGGYQLVHTYLQISTPSSPSSGYTKLYFKSDDKLYKKTSAGAETEIGSGTASAITVTNHTTSGTITCENGNVHTNNGASGTITLKLASMTEAQHCLIKRISAYRINIEPNVETDEIKDVTSGAGKGAYTESDWGQIDLLSYANTKMVPTNGKGTWTEYSPDYTPPTLTSATIPSAGTSISLLFGETVTRASETGWLMTMTGGASAMTYASGSGSNTLVYNLAREVQSDETGVLDWTAQANTIEDVNGNDLATIDDHAVTNNSTQAFPTVSSITIGTNGTSWTFAYSETVSCTSTPNCCDDFTAAMTTAGAITLSYASGSGSSSVVCTGSPTVGIGDTIANGGADYTTVSNGIEDASGNDLASFTDKAVTNNSATGISEDCASISDWTNIAQTLAATGGVCTGTPWYITTAYYTTALSTTEHWIEATCTHSANYEGGGLIVRRNASNHYYYTKWEVGKLVLMDDTATHVVDSTKTDYTTGTYLIKVSAEGTGATVTVKVYVDNVLQITFNDTSADRIVDGTYVGLAIDRDGNTEENCDNITANSL